MRHGVFETAALMGIHANARVESSLVRREPLYLKIALWG